MRTRRGKLFRQIGGAFVFVTMTSTASAAVDVFGTGDAHRGAKSVSGDEVVNTYAALTADIAAGGTSLETSLALLGAQTPFVAGDLVLVWRATGVAASEAPSGDTAKRLDLATALATTSDGTNGAGLVGLYEFARVAAVDGTTLTTTQPFVHSFGKNVTQVVRVPEYSTVTVPTGASLLPTAWQQVGTSAGWAGGILVFFATGAITNNGKIHANGRGFHGGLPPPRLLNLALSCPNPDGDPSKGYAEKGEGVVQSQYRANLGGKGNVSMAGGGGNCLEGGGGGGANRGDGGNGGKPVLGIGAGGFGGVGIDYSLLERIVMGGGGGAGEQKNGQASSGGFGGGAILVRAGSLAGSGKIESNGDVAQNSGILGLPPFVESDGAGGGGAGGSIFVRLVGGADCTGVNGKGGNGGNTDVLGLSLLGAGGGGGGGRVLFQASTVTAACVIDTSAGTAGNKGNGGSQAGDPGTAETPPPGGFCFDNGGVVQQCADPIPVCDVPTGTCQKCSGPYGGGTGHACPAANEPVCEPSGACVPCNGDLGTNATQTCQLATSPYCFLTGTRRGECGNCTTNADCQDAGHPGAFCNVELGACGTSCTKDADCKSTEWCSDAVCVPKTPNSQPLPKVAPIGGECTTEKGLRVCLSAVCEEDDDLCGRKNGKPCDAPTKCRSSICFERDRLCGKPSGEPCAVNEECRSAKCENGVCSGCLDDDDCGLGRVCEQNACIPGCRQVNGKSYCEPPKECSKKDGTIGECIDSIGAGPENPDAVDTAGVIEGAGCSCRTGVATSSSSLALLGLAIASLGLVRVRRRDRREERGE